MAGGKSSSASACTKERVAVAAFNEYPHHNWHDGCAISFSRTRGASSLKKLETNPPLPSSVLSQSLPIPLNILLPPSPPFHPFPHSFVSPLFFLHHPSSTSSLIDDDGDDNLHQHIILWRRTFRHLIFHHHLPSNATATRSCPWRESIPFATLATATIIPTHISMTGRQKQMNNTHQRNQVTL
jgi:hypothetical protein